MALVGEWERCASEGEAGRRWEVQQRRSCEAEGGGKSSTELEKRDTSASEQMAKAAASDLHQGMKGTSQEV